ncbi:hypothetical protein, partial [Burkholderia pseudomallei]|uniref:hypothetical protein n=2 Tax=Burkholderia pseudomallei TaxID=28450 RepID=UPI001C4B41BC
MLAETSGCVPLPAICVPGAARAPVLARLAVRRAEPLLFMVHRRKPWRLGERLRNLTPDFMDVRR